MTFLDSGFKDEFFLYTEHGPEQTAEMLRLHHGHVVEDGSRYDSSRRTHYRGAGLSPILRTEITAVVFSHRSRRVQGSQIRVHNKGSKLHLPCLDDLHRSRSPYFLREEEVVVF